MPEQLVLIYRRAGRLYVAPFTFVEQPSGWGGPPIFNIDVTPDALATAIGDALPLSGKKKMLKPLCLPP